MRRGCRVHTLGVGDVVVVYEEARHDAFLRADEGRAYRHEVDRRILEAFEGWIPEPPLTPLHSVRPHDGTTNEQRR